MRRLACRERDARQSLALSETDFESPDSRAEIAVPSTHYYSATPINPSISKRLHNTNEEMSTPGCLKNDKSSDNYQIFCCMREMRAVSNQQQSVPGEVMLTERRAHQSDSNMFSESE